ALLEGFRAGILMAAVAILITLRALRRTSPRSLLAGEFHTRSQRAASRWVSIGSSIAACGAIALSVIATRDASTQAGSFFGAGALLLAASLGWLWVWLSKGGRVGTVTVPRLGLRNAAHRPGRSVLSIALIAFATFLIVAIDSFRREGGERSLRYPLLAESVLPLYQFVETPLAKLQFIRYRLRPGEDASCLNLFQPRNPRIIGLPADAPNPLGDEQDPWPLLRAAPIDGAIPAIADANTLTYSLHLKIGGVFSMERTGAAPIRLRIVATLQDSIFQRELIISEDNFKRVFPEKQGYRFFLIDAPIESAASLEESLSDYGFDVTSTAERLAGFHRVENTYLSTFQTLGALGLILGTAGLAAVLLRNILENRRELALLQAVGYRTRHLATMVLAENALLLAAGLGAGTLCAAVAVAPVVMQRGGGIAASSIAPLLAGVLLTGLLASLAAIATLARSSLLDSLRSE
ncbi:MAG: FtsX-like permease family protein, partial [Bryobacteraceae bacterium]